MISIIDYAKISGQLYDLKKNPYSNLYTTTSDAKKAIYIDGWHIMKDVDDKMVPINHFFAQLYLKFHKNKAIDAVIGVRGTVFTDNYNILDDVVSWYSDALGTGNHDSAPLYYTSLLIMMAELDKIITAQHSIDNMVTTLQQYQYAWISHMPY